MVKLDIPGNCLHSEYNGAAMLAAPKLAHTDMFTMCDVYSVHLARKIYYNWCCKQQNILKGKVRRTVSSTPPVRLNMA
jgi:hypothetical protein